MNAKAGKAPPLPTDADRTLGPDAAVCVFKQIDPGNSLEPVDDAALL